MEKLIKVVCLILGGGAGSRLYPLTSIRSKPAVPIAGKYRLIDIPISNCLHSGIRRIFVLTQYNSRSLNAHIKNTYHFDNFSYAFVDIIAAEQRPGSEKWFQGTSDAVKQTLPHLAGHDYDYILILSGDQLYQMDLREFVNKHVESDAEISIATLPVNKSDASGFGIMKVNSTGFIEKFVEKPSPQELVNWVSPVGAREKAQGKEYLASMGIYVFNKETLNRMFEEYPNFTDFGKEIIPTAINAGTKVKGYSYTGYWTDIGTIKSYFDANLDLAEVMPQFNLFENDKLIYTRARMLPPTKFSGNTSLKGSVISEGCIINAKEIERCIIGNRAKIGDGTVMKNCIFFGNDYYETLEEILKSKTGILMAIGKNGHFENCIIDKDVRIGDNVKIIGNKKMPDIETENYCIRDGIVIVKKGAVIPDGTVIMI
ncbi:MAG TPA: glucose-1-phosphate adenylyltransferase [Bacteroidia bacterium]|nr:glucose-1-phosphate adenylyltransferase [Bacteroidia bacterium]HRH09660.1 glucose-1-phosphate adenylyltransferase [Bacteroidia bacterium]HRH62049.1 glucose-1-phosphate adenylyltransferase [Bacteroidia bacterium]